MAKHEESQEGCEGGGVMQPSHRGYAVAEGRQGGKNFWTAIGAAWAHPDGRGLSLTLELLPLAGQRIVLRVNVPREQGGPGESGDIPFQCLGRHRA